MIRMKTFFSYVFLGNELGRWLLALGVMLAVFTAVTVIRRKLLRKWESRAQLTQNKIDDFLCILLEKNITPAFYLLALYAGVSTLDTPGNIDKWIHIVIKIITVFIFIRIITTGVSYFIGGSDVSHEHQTETRQHSKGIITTITIIAWLTGIILLANNLGFNVSALIAGLGIGGIAVALAAQAILGDLFSYYVIFFDKPFEVGDFIVVDSKMGTIENIGIKTTRVRTLGGEQLIFSNHDLTTSRIHNYKRMEKRRVVQSLTIVYETNAELLSSIPVIAKKIVASQEKAVFDRCHFDNFGDSSLNFELVYYVMSADYTLYMDLKQSVNLGLFRAFSEAGIAFAYPTSTIYVSNAVTATNNNLQEAGEKIR